MNAAEQKLLDETVLPLLAERMDLALSRAGRLAELRQRKSLTPQEVEDLYGLDAGSLRRWRAQGRGPRYFKEARQVMYRVEDVDAWLKDNLKRTYDQDQD